MTPVRVCHVITGLVVGGAETMLAKLCESLPANRIASTVISLRAGDPLAGRIRAAGISVIELGLRPGAVPGLGDLRRLRRAIHETNPHVVQSWMYHANLSTIAVRPGAPVIWNIRQTLYDIRHEKSLTRLVVRLSALLSPIPAVILYNSSVSARQHEAIGFRHRKTQIIPNGFDVTRFAPSETSRRHVRAELGLGPEALLVGLVGRMHPMKDHPMFLDAARRVGAVNTAVTFVLVGEGTETLTASLESGDALRGRLRALGPRDDIPRLTAAFDVACSASAWGEGFPNVLGEALACGVPCVATDVGDSGEIVGEAGEIVPPSHPDLFAEALLRLLGDGPRRIRLGQIGRDRVARVYSIESVADSYAGLYERVAVKVS